MNDILFTCNGTPFTVLSLSGEERLGAPSHFELALLSTADPVDPTTILGHPGTLLLTTPFGTRPVHGLVTRFTLLATSDPSAVRRYRATLSSAFHLLTLRRRTRVFQHLTVPDLVQKVLRDAGFTADQISLHVTGRHVERAYVVQYAETDAAFIRRICEEEGLFFRFEAREGFDAFLLEDDSTTSPDAADAELPLVDEARLTTARAVAFACTSARRRRAGKVTLRDYDPAKPALSLEGVADAGLDVEKTTEMYRAPGRFKTPDQGADRARVLLESLRADTKEYQFETSAASLTPGLAVTLSASGDYIGTARPEGKLFVVAVEHTWSKESPRLSFRVTAIPREIAYRLPIVTPRPKISGIHSAVVTGAPGEEIHTDKEGHVNVRFFWDREGPTDDKSSLPVRVMQPNTPGSMLIPRVGWEVLVAFEDGDPDRPYVLGRTYNAKQLPPFSLPANKTMTALSTASSPGGAKSNAVHMDDASGRQHMVWNAGFGKTTTVANNMLTQTVGFQQAGITGNQSWTIGGKQTVSVGNALKVAVGSQGAIVAGSQSLLIKAAGSTSIGSESVAIGGSLLEQVGNPADGAAAFAEAAVLAGVSHIPLVGEALSKEISSGKALYQAYQQGGLDAMMTTAEQTLLNQVAGHVPGGDAIVAAAEGAGLTPWSTKGEHVESKAEKGGGTGGPGADAAGAAAAAPGHRKTIVDGTMFESIGSASTVTTSGSIKWTTLGASHFAVAGSHTTRAVKVNRLTGGASADTAAGVHIVTSQAIGRTISGALKTSIGGSLTSHASGPHFIKAGGPISINVGGSMDVSGGAVVFVVGGSVVAAHGGGLLLKAGKVTINGTATQSGKATNS
jgi:type VI secretion system secreted protein VgrG